jgi:hypothetical protein
MSQIIFALKIAIIIIALILLRKPIFHFIKAVLKSAYDFIIAILGKAVANIVLIAICLLLIFIITKHYERLP